MPEDFARRIIACIAHTQHLPIEQVTLDSTFEELKIDSLDGINILFALENEFNVNIPDEAATQVKSVRDLVEGLGKLIESGAATPKPTTGPNSPPAQSSVN